MMNEEPLVEILLASYQGAQNLEIQIKSLFDQTYSNWKLLIRDDGSEDETIKIIDRFAGDYPARVCKIQDAFGRLGPAGNFSALLSSSCAEYVMFCDQDDVWLPEKIEKTLIRMKDIEDHSGKETPTLIHSDLKVVDNYYSVVAESFWQHQNIHPYGREATNRLLVQNVVTGCTVMINKALRELSLPVPDTAVMHDWWLALVASTFGRIEHLDQSTMLYRQHDANEIGAKRWAASFLLKKIMGDNGQVREGILNAQNQASAFLERYRDDLPESTREVVECYANLDKKPYWVKKYLLLKYRLFKAGLIRNIGFWVHI